jgi:hypothetical protein
MAAIPSSNLHLDILMGKDETIDYEDFLNGNVYQKGIESIYKLIVYYRSCHGN